MTSASTIARHQPNSGMAALTLGAIGIVFGDIGTSPLYALKEIFSGPTAANPANVLGILSLVFWSLILMVSIKFVAIIMRADNRGEGGVLALSTLASRTLNARSARVVVGLGMMGMALFLGDSLITPAISVLSAMEGIKVAAPALDQLVIPITVVVIVFLFMIQSRGTDMVGKLFGPVMVVWFTVIGAMGAVQIFYHPGVMRALSPVYGMEFFLSNGWSSYFVLGGVVLVTTGGEALYADMGHFGRKSIKLAWTYFVMPCLVLNYFGQGALLLADPTAIREPFYLMAPHWAEWPLLILATFATVIASQAVISGAFSVTHQAIQLGYLPRREVRHTSDHAIGQVYIPRTNWMLMAGVIMLVLAFRSSDALASAYGISVVGTMTIDAVLALVVALRIWGWHPSRAWSLFGLFITVDLAFLGANLVKIPQGGWFPILVAACSFTLMWVWRKGRKVLANILYKDAMPIESFVCNQLSRFEVRAPGTSVFLCGNNNVVPLALLHNIKHNSVLHEHVVLLHVHVDDVPYARVENRSRIQSIGAGFYQVDLHFGFMDRADVPRALEAISSLGFSLESMQTSYFLGRETLISNHGHSGLSRFEEWIFIGLSKTATSATEFFSLPPNRVVEMGSQVYI